MATLEKENLRKDNEECIQILTEGTILMEPRSNFTGGRDAFSLG